MFELLKLACVIATREGCRFGVRVLRQVSAIGTPTATGEFFAMAMPALRVEGFNFTSLSN
jgi:hypothetical protein